MKMHGLSLDIHGLSHDIHGQSCICIDYLWISGFLYELSEPADGFLIFSAFSVANSCNNGHTGIEATCKNSGHLSILGIFDKTVVSAKERNLPGG